jgi:oligopeptide/dipeptide ABC transporter ATP-binding protein
LTEKLLEVKDLKTEFHTPEAVVHAVRGVSFSIAPGESFGIIGESGSGKTVTALSILGLVPAPYGRIIHGEIKFKGEDLVKKSKEELRHIRGREIGMIFQDPTTSLNPVLSVQTQLGEGMREHFRYKQEEVHRRMVSLLDSVGIKPAAERLPNYPHQFSGGMKQRLMIAISLSSNPSLIIADEPTTNLDVTIQAQILRLLEELKNKLDVSLLYITHNLGIIAKVCDRVAVMYAGKIVETGTVRQILKDPKHPYSQGLLKSTPRIGVKEVLNPIPGLPPNMVTVPTGCSFHPRCPYAVQKCRTEEPQLNDVGEGRLVSCWLY